MSALIISDKVHTVCPYCGVGCGVEVTAPMATHSELQSFDADNVAVQGSKHHPANQGRLCVKGSSLHETLDSKNRLLKAHIDGKATDLDVALQHTATTFKNIIAEHGADAVAFYVSGQLLTEDYYVANKLMKGFIGSANIDTNSRLCMSSAVAAHKRAFGSDAVPGCYEDLETTDLILMVGSNAAYAHPIVFQRITQAKKNNPNLKVIVLDPRRTATCEIADQHLALKPGSDGFFFNGLLRYMADHNGIDEDFIRAHTNGFDLALAQAKEQISDISEAAKLCDVDEKELEAIYAAFCNTEKVVTLFSQGINQSSSGCDKGNTIINCHLASGKIGKPGSAPFSITGQPNAMGGREVGGLSNQLAAHMNFSNPEQIQLVSHFWQASNMAQAEGLKAVDMFKAVDAGKIKAIWIMATNPAVSMPDANFVKQALQKCEFVVVSDCMSGTDTTNTADVLLPALTWGEKLGTVTNSERCISLQKNFLPAPGDAKSDWYLISAVAKKMGFEKAFSYRHPVEIFREHARLSGLENNASRGFDISAYSDISQHDYENLKPRQWPITSTQPNGTKRLFSDGLFYTSDRRASMIPIQARYPAKTPAQDEMIMNTGRIRDQWHTMTRTGKASRLLSHTEEPYVQIHPQDAKQRQLSNSSLVALENLNGRFIGQIKITNDQRQGEVFAPIHWNSSYASHGRVGALVNAIVDPVGGQPEFKHSPVKVKPFKASVFAKLLVANELEAEQKIIQTTEYWTKITVDGGVKYSLADTEVTTQQLAERLQAIFTNITDWVSLEDSDSKSQRIAGFIDNRLMVALLIDQARPTLPETHWLESQLGEQLELSDRYKLLAAKAGDGQSPGAIICSCYQVGENIIKQAIEDGCSTVEELGNTLKCGTNCGSCIPELKAFLTADVCELVV